MVQNNCMLHLRFHFSVIFSIFHASSLARGIYLSNAVIHYKVQ